MLCFCQNLSILAVIEADAPRKEKLTCRKIDLVRDEGTPLSQVPDGLDSNDP